MNSLIDIIHHALKRTWYGDDISNYLKYLFSIDFFHRRLRIDNQGSVRFARKEVRGGGQYYGGRKTFHVKQTYT